MLTCHAMMLLEIRVLFLMDTHYLLPILCLNFPNNNLFNSSTIGYMTMTSIMVQLTITGAFIKIFIYLIDILSIELLL